MSTQATLSSFSPSTTIVDSNETNGVIDQGQLWDPAKSIASWSWGRDISYLLQMGKTAFPIWIADMFAVGMAFISSAIFFQIVGGVPTNLSLVHVGGWCVAFTGACLLSGLYPATGMNRVREINLLFRLIVAGVALCIAYDVVHGGQNKYLTLWPIFGAFAIGLVPLSRALFRMAVCRFSWWGHPTIIIGAGDRGLEIVRQMKRHPSIGFKPVALVDRHRPDWTFNDEDRSIARISSLEDAPELSEQYQAYCGIFVGSEFPADEKIDLVDTLTSVFPQLYLTLDSADAGRLWSGTLDLGSTRLLRLTEQLLMPGARWMKRAIDVTAILLAAPLIVPLVLVLAFLVKLSSPGPAFYRSVRVGRNGRMIGIWKLRTMVPNADRLLKDYLDANPALRSDWERLHKLPVDPRVTSIGRFLRKSSLDELPQLWNVFCGDMSLVGPRPLPPAQVSMYEEIYPLYIRVTPGITGLWQVNGRSSTTHEARVSYDAEYVRNWSVSLDLYILAQTVRAVISCEGAC